MITQQPRAFSGAASNRSRLPSCKDETLDIHWEATACAASPEMNVQTTAPKPRSDFIKLPPKPVHTCAYVHNCKQKESPSRCPKIWPEITSSGNLELSSSTFLVCAKIRRPHPCCDLGSDVTLWMDLLNVVMNCSKASPKCLCDRTFLQSLGVIFFLSRLPIEDPFQWIRD